MTRRRWPSGAILPGAVLLVLAAVSTAGAQLPVITSNGSLGPLNLLDSYYTIIFNTDESMMWRRAYRFNHAVRGRLARFGVEPHPVGDRPWLDASKSGLVRLRDKLAELRK